MLKPIQALLLIGISLSAVSAASNTWLLQALRLQQEQKQQGNQLTQLQQPAGLERLISSPMLSSFAQQTQQQAFNMPSTFANTNQRSIMTPSQTTQQFNGLSGQNQFMMGAQRSVVLPNDLQTQFSQLTVPVQTTQQVNVVGRQLDASSPSNYGQVPSLYGQPQPAVQTLPVYAQSQPAVAPVASSYAQSAQRVETVPQYGQTQQRLLSPCDSNPCLNEGECLASGSSFQCKCLWGWTGARCEICLTECASNPCQAPKICKAKFGGGYDCVCPANRAGLNCELANDACANNPCLNNGVCRPIEGGTFTCECAEPWAGSRCEQRFQNPCTEQVMRSTEVPQHPNPWNRKSFLVCTDVGQFTRMACPIGTFFNEDLGHCVQEGFLPPSCPKNYCKNDAECILDENNVPRCACRKGFTGEQCEVDVDECALEGNAQCASGGGQCVDQVNGFYCRCPSGTVGLNCRDAIQNPCTEENIARDNVYFALPSPSRNVYLHCTNELQFTVTRCPDNLFWHAEERVCSTEVAPQRSGLCAALPCKNGGECQETVNGVQCLCKTGFTGQHCEQMIDFCQSNPCQNGGRCLSYAGGYTCICQDKVIDECCCHGVINPCPPKGRVLPGINNYFAHLFPHRYIHCDFEGRAFAKVCPSKTRWNQEVMSCLPEGFVLNTASPVGYGQAAPVQQPVRQTPQYQQPAPVSPPAYETPARQEQPVVSYNTPAPAVVNVQPAYEQPAPAVVNVQPAYEQPAPAVVNVQPAYEQPAPVVTYETVAPTTKAAPVYEQPAPVVVTTPAPQPVYQQPSYENAVNSNSFGSRTVLDTVNTVQTIQPSIQPVQQQTQQQQQQRSQSDIISAMSPQLMQLMQLLQSGQIKLPDNLLGQVRMSQQAPQIAVQSNEITRPLSFRYY